MKCSKCGKKKETQEYDPEWISPRWEDTGWYHVCPSCHHQWYRIWTSNEKKLFLEFIQPERSKREDHESGCGALNSMET